MSAPASAPAPTGSDPTAVPLPVGSTLDRGFALLGRQPRPLLVPALLLYLVPMAITLVLAAVGMLLIGDVDSVSEQVRESTFFGDSTLETREVANLTDGQWAIVGVFGLIAAIAFMWFSVAGYAAMVRGAQRALDGADPLPLREALRDALRQAPRLFGLSLLALIVLAVGALVAGLVLLGVYALSTGAALLVGLGIGLFLVYLMTRLLLWPVVVVVEARGVDSFSRAWALTVGRFWSLLALGLLLLVVVMAVNVVATLVLEAAFGALNALDETVGTWALIPYTGLSLVISVVFSAAYLAPLVVAHHSLAGGGHAADGDDTDAVGSAAGIPSFGGADDPGLDAADRSA